MIYIIDITLTVVYKVTRFIALFCHGILLKNPISIRIYLIITFIALVCRGVSLKKPIWPRKDLNPRRLYQSTDMLTSRPQFHYFLKCSFEIMMHLV